MVPMCHGVKVFGDWQWQIQSDVKIVNVQGGGFCLILLLNSKVGCHPAPTELDCHAAIHISTPAREENYVWVGECVPPCSRELI